MLKNKLINPDFISRYRTSPTYFTRDRSFTFLSLALFIISSIQSSIQRELDRFFKTYNSNLLAEQFVSQSAFSQARLKIDPKAFVELRNDVTSHFYSNYQVNKWFGFRLIAVDGSSAVLPKNTETIKEFGMHTTDIEKKSVVLARISKAYDVLNNLTIDAMLTNPHTDERTLATRHLSYCGKGDVMLFDRGYPSFELFRDTLASGAHFCARVSVANWGIAKRLVESGKKQIIVELEPSEKFLKKHKTDGVIAEPIKCRFVCVELPSGEKEVLVTSLLDMQEYPHHVFKKLYHLRWGIEESYKKDKHRLQLENFSGKTITAIYQDFYANMLLGNLTAILSSSIQGMIKKKKNMAKHKYQVNITTSLSKVKDTIILLFIRMDVSWLLYKLEQMFLCNLLPVRQGRSFDRKKFNRKRYHKTYLPL